MIYREKIDGMQNISEETKSFECNDNDIRIENLISARTFSYRPVKSTTDYLKLSPQKWVEELTISAETVESIKTFQNLHKEHIAKHPIDERANEYPKIVFLGTGSSCPTKVRNASGILVHLRFVPSVQFLDAGSPFSMSFLSTARRVQYCWTAVKGRSVNYFGFTGTDRTMY